MLYPDFEDLLQLGYRASKLSLASRRRVTAAAAGGHESPFRGRGLEFQEVREYVPGDDVRNIDWRVTARTGRPHLKLFAEERERAVVICVDRNDSMRFGTRGTFKSIQAARAAALLGWAANRGGNRTGGALFGNVPGGMMFFTPVRSRRSLWQMMTRLCDQADAHDREVPLEEHLRLLCRAASGHPLVFIISDFAAPGDSLKRRLGDLHRRADVVLVSVNDPADRALPPVGPLLFTGRGGRRLAVDTADPQGAAAYTKQWEENRAKLRGIVGTLGLGFIALTTDGDLYRDLSRGLRKLEKTGGGIYEQPAFATA